ncbi:MAG: hypothetical protein ACFCD0_16730 [Gemmataceae bacterium]
MKEKLAIVAVLLFGCCLLTGSTVDADGTQKTKKPKHSRGESPVFSPSSGESKPVISDPIPPTPTRDDQNLKSKGLSTPPSISQMPVEKKNSADLHGRYLAIQKKLADHLSKDDLAKRILEGEKQLSEINANRELEKLKKSLAALVEKYPGTQAAQKAKLIQGVLRGPQTRPAYTLPDSLLNRTEVTPPLDPLLKGKTALPPTRSEITEPRQSDLPPPPINNFNR